jgi:hypothetical protein
LEMENHNYSNDGRPSNPPSDPPSPQATHSQQASVAVGPSSQAAAHAVVAHQFLPLNLSDPQTHYLLHQLSMAGMAATIPAMQTQQVQLNGLYHPQQAALLPSLLFQAGISQNGISQAGISQNGISQAGIANLNPHLNNNIHALAANLPAMASSLQQATQHNVTPQPGNAAHQTQTSLPTTSQPKSHSGTGTSIERSPGLTNRPPVPVYLDYDEQTLTGYQCLLRKQLELFEAGPDEVRGSAQGRNTPISLGQVGIRCRHCASLPKAARNRGAVYYSKTIDGLYQVAQNMSKLHLCKTCHKIPEDTQRMLIKLQKVNNRASGGKEYWAEGLRVLGTCEDGNILRFQPNWGKETKLPPSQCSG